MFLVFTDTVIAAQVFTFITAGSEAISSTLSFTLYELAKNPDIQSRLQMEIDSVLSTQELSYNSLRKMTYMEQVLNGTYLNIVSQKYTEKRQVGILYIKVRKIFPINIGRKPFIFCLFIIFFCFLKKNLLLKND